jgi:hypothetical protein
MAESSHSVWNRVKGTGSRPNPPQPKAATQDDGSAATPDEIQALAVSNDFGGLIPPAGVGSPYKEMDDKNRLNQALKAKGKNPNPGTPEPPSLFAPDGPYGY